MKVGDYMIVKNNNDIIIERNSSDDLEYSGCDYIQSPEPRLFDVKHKPYTKRFIYKVHTGGDIIE